jgi:hypothetical protein
MLKKIGIAFAVIVVVVVALGFVMPKTQTAEQSIVINAPPAAIYPDIASLKAWNEWTEWSTRNDPTWHPQYSGPDVGAGSEMTWTDGESGAGSQKITAADPATGVKFEIVIIGGSVVIRGDIAMQPEGNATKVTWRDTFDLSNSFLFRYFGPLMPGETEKKMIPSLANLKTRSEQRASSP